MKVVHIESGLGNQMLSYCELLALKKMNPNDKFYIETMVYDIPECNETICQWNGYELDRIFGIDTPNIKCIFEEATWDSIIQEVKESRFWEKNWNWPVYIARALNNAGLHLINVYGDREEMGRKNNKGLKEKLRLINFTQTRIGTTFRGLYYKFTEEKRIASVDHRKEVFLESESDLLAGQRLCMKFKGNGIELIEKEIAEVFKFPAFLDEKNKQFAEFLNSCNSVFIHARRGDMLSYNGWCYKFGYFRKAVKYIKNHVENPVFVFFTNSGSIEWCKENQAIFGLEFSKDEVYFVDWNTNNESFRDMQLMSFCKHGIITNSTFGWWGAYFIKNPGKITISPEIYLNTTYNCY